MLVHCALLRNILAACCCLLLAPTQTLPKTAIAGILMYQGADRDQRVINEARKEGTLSLYTSLNPKDSGSIVQAFQKKYNIKVAVWRSSGEGMIERTVTEARAGRFTPDVME